MSNIATMFEIQQACSNAYNSSESMSVAAEIAIEAEFNPKIIELLLKYTAVLSAGVATNMVQVLMSQSDFHHMISELKEFQNLDKEI